MDKRRIREYLQDKYKQSTRDDATFNGVCNRAIEAAVEDVSGHRKDWWFMLDRGSFLTVFCQWN